MIDYDEIRKQIAIEHNFLIAKEDPLLISITLSELVIQRYVDMLEERNLKHRKALEDAIQKGIAEAKVTAGSVITQATGYASTEINAAITAALDEAIQQFKEELAEVRREVKLARHTAVTASIISFGCAVVTIGALVFSVGS